MRPWDLSLTIACVAAGLGWAVLAAWRAGEARGAFPLRALLGGAAAFGIAVCTYDLASFAGMPFDWDRIVRADLGGAALLAGAIGLFEEGAKLAGVLLVVGRGWRTRSVLAAAVGVAAGFAAMEAFTTLYGWGSPLALARAALGPVAHALLAVPLGLGVAAWSRRGRAAAPLVALGLLASAALHAGGDLSLALPRHGSLGYAAALLVPLVWLHLLARRALRTAPAVAQVGLAAAPPAAR
jgi:RsiW-degrading membrane proteinase PrsW (M82 family)